MYGVVQSCNECSTMFRTFPSCINKIARATVYDYMRQLSSLRQLLHLLILQLKTEYVDGQNNAISSSEVRSLSAYAVVSDLSVVAFLS